VRFDRKMHLALPELRKRPARPDGRHQTVKLAQGRHTSPEQGACVMELASMLAGERFRDDPRCVCPVIAAFLRSYNDALDAKRRQDLYRFAAESVGTAAGSAVRAERGRACMAWFTAEVPRERRTRFFGLETGVLAGRRLNRISRATQRYARHTTDASHADALRFIDRLIAIGPAGSGEREPVAERLRDEMRPRAGADLAHGVADVRPDRLV
jgi:hypothetical protein